MQYIFMFNCDQTLEIHLNDEDTLNYSFYDKLNSGSSRNIQLGGAVSIRTYCRFKPSLWTLIL